MEYTKIPRGLIYKDRTDLNDFGVKNPGTINNYLFTQMRKLTLLRCGCAKEIALQCFNNAYYICTLIQLDEFPDLCMDKYEKKLMEVTIPYLGDVYQASMALVCVLLAAYDDKYKQKDDPLIDSIHNWTSSKKWVGSNCRKSFDDIINTCNTDGLSLPEGVFAPRDIIDAIENVNVDDLVVGVIYVCNGLALLNDSNLRSYGANLAISRLNDDLQEIYEDYGYDPQTKKFVSETNDPLRYYPDEYKLLDKITLLKKKAVEYIIEHYPAKEEDDSKEKAVETPRTPETDVLQSKIRELESILSQKEKKLMEANSIKAQYVTQIEKLDAENNSLRNELKEAHTITDAVPAQQKVRMELARRLMNEAGITEEVLAKWGNKDKAGTLMGTMLDILPSTCKTYLSDPVMNYEHHKNTVDKINPLLEALGLKFKL